MSTRRTPDDRADVPPVLAVLLIDDHRVFTDALRISLDRQPDLRCVAVAHSAHEGLASAAKAGFAVAVVDLGLPDTVGVELVEGLHRLRPASRIVVLTAHPRPHLAERALDAGASAFLGKGATLDQILAAVRTSDPRRPTVDAAAARAAAGDDTVPLTLREHEVLRHLGCGHDAGRIAGELGISLHTTRDHIKTVMGKLGAHSQLGAVVTAERKGLITLGSRY